MLDVFREVLKSSFSFSQFRISWRERFILSLFILLLNVTFMFALSSNWIFLDFGWSLRTRTFNCNWSKIDTRFTNEMHNLYAIWFFFRPLKTLYSGYFSFSMQIQVPQIIIGLGWVMKHIKAFSVVIGKTLKFLQYFFPSFFLDVLWHHNVCVDGLSKQEIKCVGLVESWIC